MDRLYFSRRARSRRRRKRALAALGIVSFALTVAGVPWSRAGVDLLEQAVMRGLRREAGTAVTTSESAASMMRFRAASFETRPTPSPDQRDDDAEAAPETPDTIPEIIYAAAAEFGISGDYLLSIADCESGLDPGASSGAGYYGLFQFDQQTWAAYGYGSIYDPTAQARAAARLLAAGQSSRWPICA